MFDIHEAIGSNVTAAVSVVALLVAGGFLIYSDIAVLKLSANVLIRNIRLIAGR